MKKRIILVAAIFSVLLMFAGCGLFRGPTVEIQIGRMYPTQWFFFSIHSVERVDGFAGRTAAPGHQLWKVEITQIGTFPEPVPMGTFDWFMDDDSFRAYMWPHIAFDGRMMPEFFWLDIGQRETHIMLFEVPAETTNLTLNFVEIDYYGAEGSHFVLRLQ